MSTEVASYVSRTDPTYVVEAVRLHETDTDWGAVADWCGVDVRVLGSPDLGLYSLLELGLDGAVHGDWVVKQPGGWFVWAHDGFVGAFRLVTS